MALTISLEDLPRCEWLDLRRMGLGGSDAAIVCGVSPWRTARELYEDKLGNIPADDTQTEWQEWGHRLEPVIREAVEDKTGYKTCPSKYMLWSEEHEFLFVDMDGLVDCPERGAGVLEIKTAFRFDSGWGPSGTDEVPVSYMLQCQHAMMVSGYRWCLLAVLVGGNTFRWYIIEWSERIIPRLMGAEASFWAAVENGKPPEFDHAHGSTKDLLIELHSGVHGEMHFPFEAQSWHETFQTFAEKEKSAKDGRAAVRNLVLEAMGDAQTGFLPDGSRYVRAVTKAGAHTLRHKK